MKFIEPVISEDSAWRQLTRRRLNGVRFLARTVARRVGDNADLWERAGQPQRLRGTVPFLEILWLPYYRVQLAAQSGDRSLTIEALVDGHEATFTPWDFAEVHWVESLDRESFAASIDAATALSVARQGFLDAALRRAEWTRDVRLLSAEGSELIHYPYWVYYFERRTNKLDFRMLDGVTGRPGGAKMKLSLLKALRLHDSHDSKKVQHDA